MFCTQTAGSTQKDVQDLREKGDVFYAYRIGRSIWNDRRCTVHWTVEGECLVEEAHATTGAERQSHPRLSVRINNTRRKQKEPLPVWRGSFLLGTDYQAAAVEVEVYAGRPRE